VVDLLLERGAPVSAKTRNGLTALHMAAQGDHFDTARVLLFHKAFIDDVTVVCALLLCVFLLRLDERVGPYWVAVLSKSL